MNIQLLAAELTRLSPAFAMDPINAPQVIENLLRESMKDGPELEKLKRQNQAMRDVLSRGTAGNAKNGFIAWADERDKALSPTAGSDLVTRGEHESKCLSLYPDVCPFTGLAFFMVLNHPELGDVPTYGGPFDSYTIPRRCANDGDQQFERLRYDHDEGCWKEWEGLSLQVISDEKLFNIEDERDQLRTQLANSQAAHDLAIKRHIDAQNQLNTFSELAQACRVRLLAEGWENPSKYSDADAIKRYILNSEYHAQAGN